MTAGRPALVFHPLTPERWDLFEALFGARGACGGCWCMLWRRTRAEFERDKGAPNRTAMRRLVHAGPPPGVLAVLTQPFATGGATVPAGTAVGWCAVAPREAYPALDRSRVLRRVDDAPVWSISCLFIARPLRRRGVSVALLRAAATFAARHGARVVEGYPVEPRAGCLPDVFAWTGVPAAFEAAGFREIARRSPTRPIMRRVLRARGR